MSKYEGREEEFLKYVYSKYEIIPPWLIPQPVHEVDSSPSSIIEEDNQSSVVDSNLIGNENDNEISNNKSENETRREVRSIRFVYFLVELFY